MKLPSYIKVSKPRSDVTAGGIRELKVSVSIKRWGWPILVHRFIKSTLDYTWFSWPRIWLLIYPRLCIRMMWGRCHGA